MNAKKIAAASALAALCACSFALDGFVGEYKGEIRGQKGYPYDNNFEMRAQISKHKDGYKLRLIPELLKRCENELLISALKDEGGKIAIDSAGKWKLSGEISNGEIWLEGERMGKTKPVITLKKFERKSETLGAKPPKGAVALFDGSNADEWLNGRGLPPAWEITADGAWLVSKKNAANDDEKRKEQSVRTKRGFTNFTLHLEFMTPDLNQKEGQARGNSGVFIGPYETQILDSFGGEGYWNDCGAIYRILPPQVNASLPPQTWQTYDIDFQGAVFEGGKLVKRPVITVYLNGVKIQENVEIPHGTSLKQADRKNFRHPAPPYKITLQDHGDPVRFRNIWILEK